MLFGVTVLLYFIKILGGSRNYCKHGKAYPVVYCNIRPHSY